jgi:hypothetical protein
MARVKTLNLACDTRNQRGKTQTKEMSAQIHAATCVAHAHRQRSHLPSLPAAARCAITAIQSTFLARESLRTKSNSLSLWCAGRGDGHAARGRGGPTRDELKIPTLIRGDVRRASYAQDAQRSTLPAAGIPSLRCLAKVRKLVLREQTKARAIAFRS